VIYRTLFFTFLTLAVLSTAALLLHPVISNSFTTPQTFPDPSPQGAHNWYSPLWQYRQQITIQHSQVASSLTDFPVLVKIQGHIHPVFHSAKFDGSDLIFTAADGTTPVAAEIENYNPTTAALTVWVKVPDLSAVEDTKLWMYFGNPAATREENSTTVWSSGYEAVYLMNQGPKRLEVKDSTQTSSDYITTRGEGAETEGKVGVALNFNGQDTIVDLGSAAAGSRTDILPPFTFSAWIKPTTLAGTIIGKREGESTQWQFFTDVGGHLMLKEDATGHWSGHQSATSETRVKRGQWQHVVVTVDKEGNPTFYHDGISELGNQQHGTFLRHPINASLGARWSHYPSPDYQFSGLIDDVRIAHVARSSDWIKTEYNNQNNPDTFATVQTTLQQKP
jgi:hypothetical protein